MGNEFPDADDIVVACGTIADNAGVIEDAAGECAGRVARGAIFCRRHMVDGLAQRIGPVVAGIAAHRGHYVSRVVDKCSDKILRIMARAAVCGGYRMIYRHAGCGGSIVARGAGLSYRIEDRVVKRTAHVKRPDAMAGHAIHVCHGMILGLADRVNAIMTGNTVNRYVAVVDMRRQEGICRMAKIALTLS